MERKKISLSGLGEVLTPQEMKNITGGSCKIVCGDGTNFSAPNCHYAESYWCGMTTLEGCNCG